MIIIFMLAIEFVYIVIVTACGVIFYSNNPCDVLKRAFLLLKFSFVLIGVVYFRNRWRIEIILHLICSLTRCNEKRAAGDLTLSLLMVD